MIAEPKTNTLPDAVLIASLRAELDALRQQEPFGFFRATAFDWEVCAEGDEGRLRSTKPRCLPAHRIGRPVAQEFTIDGLRIRLTPND